MQTVSLTADSSNDYSPPNINCSYLVSVDITQAEGQTVICFSNHIQEKTEKGTIRSQRYI